MKSPPKKKKPGATLTGAAGRKLTQTILSCDRSDSRIDQFRARWPAPRAAQGKRMEGGRRTEEQSLFGFMDDEISFNPKKQADAATYRPCN